MKRFIEVYNQQPSMIGKQYKVIVDTETGVNYLQMAMPNFGGASITPLLNEDGEPVIFTKSQISELENK